MNTIDNEWAEAEALANQPQIAELLQGFTEDPTGDSGTMIVREVMRALAAKEQRVADNVNHDIADRLAGWLSASMDQHAAIDEMRTHIRAWLDFQSTHAAKEQREAVMAKSERKAFEDAVCKIVPRPLFLTDAQSGEYTEIMVRGFLSLWQAGAAYPRALLSASSAAWPVHPVIQDRDLASLKRFNECCEDSDSGGHDVSKESMARLREIGLVQSKGFGRDQITAFGDYVLLRLNDEPTSLPLKTYAEYNAESMARIATLGLIRRDIDRLKGTSLPPAAKSTSHVANQFQLIGHLLRLPTVEAQTGLSKSEIYRRMKAGTFPHPLNLGKRAVAWKALDIDTWITSLAQGTKNSAP